MDNKFRKTADEAAAAPSKSETQHLDMIAAYNERRRTFEALGNTNLSDDGRKAALESYRDAAAAFDKARADVLRK